MSFKTTYNVRVVNTTPYNIDIRDEIIVYTGAAAATFSLYNPSGAHNGMQVIVKKAGNSPTVGNITVNVIGGGNIDNGTTSAVGGSFGSTTFCILNNQWGII